MHSVDNRSDRFAVRDLIILSLAIGEGGCVVTRDSQIADDVALLRFHGSDREAGNRFGKKGGQDYEIIAPDYTYNMMDMQAALGLHQLKALDGPIRRRTELALRYQDLLSGWPQLSLPANRSTGSMIWCA